MATNLHVFICTVCIAVLFWGCAPERPLLDEPSATTATMPPETDPTYRVYLLGNIASHIAASHVPVRSMLDAHLSESDIPNTVALIGNSIPCCGFPDSADANRSQVESYLTSWLDIIKKHDSRLVAVPGHHENPGAFNQPHGEGSFESFIESYMGNEDIFLPSHGFPGPESIALTDDIRLLAIDTQYWMNDYAIPADTLGEEVREPSDVLLELEDELFKHRNDRMLLIGHHPLFSNGNYGGRFSWRQYLLPVPLLSGFIPVYRTLIGYRQDLVSVPYRLFRHEMQRMLEDRHNLMYASAHERSLQYFRKDNRRRIQHHIVSGSASGSGHVSQGRGVNYATSDQGFFIIDFYDDGAAWLSAWTQDENAAHGRMRFTQQLITGNPLVAQEPTSSPPHPALRDKKETTTQAINPRYAKVSQVGKWFFGEQYRDLWATPIEVPALDVTTEAGGLTPSRVGGQSQSVTVRLSGGDGDTYMLRSIDKVVTRSLSPALQRTFARNILQDQVAMMHPFGAFVLPSLSEAAGIYHTKPRLVYIPERSLIGQTSSYMANQIVLFEERPDEDMSDKAHFGYSKNIVGSAKLMSEIMEDNDHRVDPTSFARARLFDMLIADHDRTLDNFRWASFEPYELYDGLTEEARTQGKVYVTVPRDRDRAFVKVEGLFPTLYRVLAEPGWQPFRKKYGFINGLNRKGMFLDRRFTASLTRDDWIQLAEDLKQNLSDEVIEASILQWPEPIQEAAGEELIETLKARRNKLPDVANTYYNALSDVIDVVGSHKHERFEISRLDEQRTEVVVYKTTKEGEIRNELFRRMVDTEDTREVRLYGMDGNDQFIINGTVGKGPRIIAVGGAGADLLQDASVVQKGPKKTRFYDIPEGTTIESGPETKTYLKLTAEVNRYNFEGYKPDLIRPVAFFGSNSDDGVFVGTGFKWTRHGFRKEPHAATHQFMGNYAARTKAFNIRYLGNFVTLIDNWDLDLDVGIFSPNNIRNFYGLGNETEDTEDSRRFYQARFSNILVNTALVRSFESGITFRIGPSLEVTDVRNEANRFVSQPQSGVSTGSFDHLFFARLVSSLDIQSVDNTLNPLQGFRFNTTLELNKGIRETNDSYLKMQSSWTMYASPSLSPQLTVALRAGGAHNIGDFPFFEANTLGGAHNLRGFRSTRFAGRSSLFTNIETRLQLASFSGYLGYGRVGLTGFYDTGRVWTDGESSRRWHQGYGGGLWVNYFEQLMIATELGLSNEDPNFTIRLGFLY